MMPACCGWRKPERAKSQTSRGSSAAGRQASSAQVAPREPRAREDLRDFGGFALESEFVDAEGKNRSSNIVKELIVGSVDQAVFSLEGYEIQELPSLGQ